MPQKENKGLGSTVLTNVSPLLEQCDGMRINKSNMEDMCWDVLKCLCMISEEKVATIRQESSLYMYASVECVRGKQKTKTLHDVFGRPLLCHTAVSISLTLCVFQSVFRVSYLHSHALCSVKLMKISFCCLWGFILLICKKKKKRRKRNRHRFE